MKAFLLAAGIGSRLKPITDSMPKCLVEICGTPLLGWWLLQLQKYNVNEVLINLHHFPEKIKDFILSTQTPIKINYYYEKTLLGSAGTLRENKNFVKDETDFFVCYADNLTNYNLGEFYRFHKERGKIASISLFKTDTPSIKGIVELDASNTVISFEEKPQNPKSNLANAGVYLFTPLVLEFIPNTTLTDIGYDLLPKLVNDISGWVTKDYLIDIGTHQHLLQAQNDWKQIIGKEF